jgi:hypothetical protein
MTVAVAGLKLTESLQLKEVTLKRIGEEEDVHDYTYEQY